MALAYSLIEMDSHTLIQDDLFDINIKNKQKLKISLIDYKFSNNYFLFKYIKTKFGFNTYTVFGNTVVEQRGNTLIDNHNNKFKILRVSKDKQYLAGVYLNNHKHGILSYLKMPKIKLFNKNLELHLLSTSYETLDKPDEWKYLND